MARDEHRVIAHGPQALTDAADQVFVVALGKVGAPDAAGKQHIAHKGALYLRRMEHHMARRVARAMAHVQRVRAERDGVAVFEPARRRERPGGRKTVVHGRHRQAIDPELVTPVGADDGQAQLLGQIGRATAVVQMPVRHPDLFELEAQLLDRVEQHIQITAGVDDGGLHRLVVPDERAVLLKSGDRDGEVLEHGPIMSRPGRLSG